MYTRNCEIKPGVDFPPDMHRVALGVAYNGATYNGFQRQASTASTVQAYLESALSGVAAEPISLVCAGRTDAGVHAAEQVVHFDTLAQRPAKAWVKGVNCKLPDDIRVHWAKSVPPSFHARFSATSRTYRYVLLSADVRPAYLHKNVTWTQYCLDISRMQAAANYLVGEHHFSSFRSSRCQANNPVRTVEYLTLKQQGPFIVVEIKANAFLHHMVRNIVGTLIDVGRGAYSPEWVGEVLALGDRTKAAATASPCGLYFVKAEYHADFGLPRHEMGPLFLQV
ncbi:MAG: tRNA pseudouridine(38-40) synthase TruA [Agarilytica sp.]